MWHRFVFFCYTELLWLMDLLFVLLSHCDKLNMYMLQNVLKRKKKNTEKAQKVPKSAKKGKKYLTNAWLLAFFGIFLGTSTHFVCPSD